MTQDIDVVHQQIEADVAPILANARAIAHSVVNQDGYDAAAAYLLRVKDIRKKLTDSLEPFVQTAHRAWKDARKRVDAYYLPVDSAEQIVKPAMANWWERQEQDRIQKQREAEEAAKKAEEERIVGQAIQAAENGSEAEAEAILDQPVNVAPVILPGATQTKGVSVREVWGYEVTNLMDLVRAVAAGRVSIQAIRPNEVFLGQQARSLKGEMKVPGVRVFSQKVVAAGSR